MVVRVDVLLEEIWGEELDWIVSRQCYVSKPRPADNLRNYKKKQISNNNAVLKFKISINTNVWNCKSSTISIEILNCKMALSIIHNCQVFWNRYFKRWFIIIRALVLYIFLQVPKFSMPSDSLEYILILYIRWFSSLLNLLAKRTLR
jgi:hypothetical protein